MSEKNLIVCDKCGRESENINGWVQAHHISYVFENSPPKKVLPTEWRDYCCVNCLIEDLKSSAAFVGGSDSEIVLEKDNKKKRLGVADILFK